MAIVDMSVFTLIGPAKKREKLLKELQGFEYVHFIDMKEVDPELLAGSQPEDLASIEEARNRVAFILEELGPYDPRPQGLRANLVARPSYSLEELAVKKETIEEEELYKKTRELSQAMEEINQEIVKLGGQLVELEPWQDLDFDLALVENTKSTQVVMGSYPRRFEDSFNRALLDYPEVYYKRVSEASGMIYCYLIYLGDNRESVEDLLRSHGFSQQEVLGRGSPSQEKKAREMRLEELEEEKLSLQAAFKDLAQSLEEVEVLYEFYENQKLIYGATDNFLATRHMDIISGYVPTKRLEEFEGLVRKSLGEDYYLESEAADIDEDIPVLLENSPLVDSFSGITSMYAMPRYNEIDPTPLLAPFYWLFFGMMGADVGYGLLLLVLSALVLKFVPLQKTQKNFLKFFFYLSISLVIWGFIYGSALGGLIPLKGLIDTSKDFTTLLILSIIMGMIHLFFGLGIKAYMLIRDGKYLDAVYDVLFWFMAIVGGIVFLLAMSLGLPDPLGPVGKWVMIAGMVGIVLFAGRESESLGGRLGTGFYELYGISSYVGDFVSYSRLMALGLSGGFIALSINIIVGIVIDKGVIGLISGILIFIVFHLFNIFLSMLSAYVHTSRLTYVEFFGKFYEGGGKAFKLFKTDPKYIEINNQGGKL